MHLISEDSSNFSHFVLQFLRMRSNRLLKLPETLTQSYNFKILFYEALIYALWKTVSSKVF